MMTQKKTNIGQDKIQIIKKLSKFLFNFCVIEICFNIPTIEMIAIKFIMEVNLRAPIDNAKAFKNSPAPTKGASGINKSEENFPLFSIYFVPPM